MKINDSYILQYFTNKVGKINGKLINKFIHKHNCDENILNYLLNRFLDTQNIKEVLARIKHNISENPICPTCGKKLQFTNSINHPYNKHCNSKCSANDPNTTKQREQTNLVKYGCKNISQNENIKRKKEETCLKNFGVKAGWNTNKTKLTMIERYGVDHNWKNGILREKLNNNNLLNTGNISGLTLESIEKRKQTCQMKYGGNSPASSNEVFNKMKDTCFIRYNSYLFIQSDDFITKTRKTCKEKYGCEFYQNSDDFKEKISKQFKVINNDQNIKEKKRETCRNKFGYDCYQNSNEFKQMISDIMKTPEVQKKRNATLKENGTFNTSKPEQNTFDLLKTKFPDIMTQYMDDRYPFRCDFYIPSLDLFIECQYSWTHGDHPYNEETDKEKLELWESKNTQYYRNAINTWTKRDTNKRKIAKQNKLNYLEFFSYDYFLIWFNQQ